MDLIWYVIVHVDVAATTVLKQLAEAIPITAGLAVYVRVVIWSTLSTFNVEL